MIKLYCEPWLQGTIRAETPTLRAIWVDLLALAGSGAYGDEGIIQIAPGVGLTDQQFPAVLGISETEWAEARARLIATERIRVNKGNSLHITNWAKYQSEYSRQKSYRGKLQPKVTTKSNQEKEIEKERDWYPRYPRYPPN